MYNTLTRSFTSLLLVTGASAVVQNITSTSSPWFCHELDCPTYVVVRNTSSYEVRQYTAANWVSVNLQNYTYRSAMSQGFELLFDYISGRNSAQVKINMTAPVLTKVIPGAGPFCESNFTVSFYVPTQQGETPVPTNSRVYLSTSPAALYFVSSYSGFADDSTVPAQAAALTSALRADGESFEYSYYHTAGYDSPYQLSGRHNEIWIPAQRQQQAQRLPSTPAKAATG